MNFLRLFWAKVRVLSSLPRFGPVLPGRPHLEFDELRSVLQRLEPRRRPYELLASIYPEYGRRICPNFVPLLAALQKVHARPIQSVLDLACGTGILTMRLAATFPRVVGLDISNEMLDQARIATQSHRNVEYTQGDFRSFDLADRFDAVVCSTNSLNYVESRADLGRVFQCVARHLIPGGFFLFDVINEAGCRRLSDRTVHVEVNGTRCALCFRYDSERRQEESLAVFSLGVERHCRIPVDREDVLIAAEPTALVIVDTFSQGPFGIPVSRGLTDFYVLRHSRGGATKG